jgi:hypothetical protein
MNRTPFCALALVAIGVGVCGAQTVSPVKELRIRFGNVAARASASLQCADAIEARLRARGSTLHPQIAFLRVQIEAALDEAQAALASNDDAGASAALVRAEALIDRFGRHFGH